MLETKFEANVDWRPAIALFAIGFAISLGYAAWMNYQSRKSDPLVVYADRLERIARSWPDPNSVHWSNVHVDKHGTLCGEVDVHLAHRMLFALADLDSPIFVDEQWKDRWSYTDSEREQLGQQWAQYKACKKDAP